MDELLEKLAAAQAALEAGDTEALSVLLGEAAAMAQAASESGAAMSEGGDSPDMSEEDREALAAMSAIRGITTLGVGESVERIRKWKADADTRHAEAQRLEQSQRRELTTELIKLGVETPATAWAAEPEEGKEPTPCARLMSEPLEGLRERVKAMSALPPRAGATPAGADEGSGIDLTELEKSKLSTMSEGQRERFLALRAKRVRGEG